MALALYRRYRPDSFDGIIGQDHVTKPLSRALDEGKLTHAYLFSGPRGCGKTSSARILARCINCVEGPTSKPCGKCDSCRDLATNGPGSIDVVEIDAASHGSVEDARELRERAGFAPARDHYKIFILDEAHMVTSNGFNALLKIVEEPPEHVMFIFATTEPDKVISTIRSRTHHYPFRLVPPEVMQPYLEEICEKESIHPEPGVLKLAMRAGGGSMRDTLSVLDQLMVGVNQGKITYDDSVALLGFTPDSLIHDAIDAVIAHDGPVLYSVVEKVVTGGFDPRKFVEDLLAYVRDLLVLSIAGQQAQSALSLGQSSQILDEMLAQSSKLNLQSLNIIAERINNALNSMTGTLSPRMRLELLAAQLLVPFVDTEQNVRDDSSSARPDIRHNRQSVAKSPRQRAQEAMAQERDEQSKNSRQSNEKAGFDNEEQKITDVSDSDNVSAAPSEVAQNVGNNTAGNSQKLIDTTQAGQEWALIVNSLPEKIRTVVDNERIPHVDLVEKSGRYLMMLTFANPLSQHAFALAVSSEPVNGETSLQKILNSKLQERYHAPIVVAPAPHTADGQTVTPLRNLPIAEQAQVKAQVAQMAAQALMRHSQVAAHAQKSSSQQSKNSLTDTPTSAHSDSNDNSYEPSDEDDHHRVQPADTETANPSVADDFDPWAVPAEQEVNKQQDEVYTPSTSDSSAEYLKNNGEEISGDDEALQEDQIDPWAQTVSNHEYGAYEGSSTDSSENSQSVGSSQEHKSIRELAQTDSEVLKETNQTDSNIQSQDNAERIAAEDDHYSLDDETNPIKNIMNTDDIEKLFNAKQVEEFLADGSRKIPGSEA